MVEDKMMIGNSMRRTYRRKEDYRVKTWNNTHAVQGIKLSCTAIHMCQFEEFDSHAVVTDRAAIWNLPFPFSVLHIHDSRLIILKRMLCTYFIRQWAIDNMPS